MEYLCGRYNKRGFQDVFLPLSETCTESSGLEKNFCCPTKSLLPLLDEEPNEEPNTLFKGTPARWIRLKVVSFDISLCVKWRGAENLRASLFNEGLSDEPNFFRIHLVGQYL